MTCLICSALVQNWRELLVHIETTSCLVLQKYVVEIRLRKCLWFRAHTFLLCVCLCLCPCVYVDVKMYVYIKQTNFMGGLNDFLTKHVTILTISWFQPLSGSSSKGAIHVNLFKSFHMHIFSWMLIFFYLPALCVCNHRCFTDISVPSAYTFDGIAIVIIVTVVMISTSIAIFVYSYLLSHILD